MPGRFSKAIKMKKCVFYYDGSRNTGTDEREVSQKNGGLKEDGFLKEVKIGCWFYRNNNIQNRLVHCVPRLLKQKTFLIGTFNKDLKKI